MKKKLLMMLLAATMVFTAVGCGKEKEEESTEVVESYDEEESEEIAEESSVEESQEKDVEAAKQDKKEVSIKADETEETKKKLEFDIPEDFQETEENYWVKDGTYGSVVFDYSVDKDDSTFDIMSADIMKETMKELDVFGEDLDVEIIEEEYFSVDGYKAMKYGLAFSASGMDFSEWQYLVQIDDELHMLTFVCANGSDATEDFTACMDSVRVVEYSVSAEDKKEEDLSELILDIPDEFEEYEEDLWLVENESNIAIISVSSSESNDSGMLELINEDMVETMLNSAFSDDFDDFVVLDEEYYELDGNDAAKFKFSADRGNINGWFLLIEAPDQFYTVAFLEYYGDEYTDVFEKCMEDIRIE